MNCRELRIGNIVMRKADGAIVKVEQITKKKIGYHIEGYVNMKYLRYSEIKPVPLNDEKYNNGDMILPLLEDIMQGTPYEPASVHELQNLWYGLYKRECCNDK